jgi:hypothetical protein
MGTSHLFTDGTANEAGAFVGNKILRALWCWLRPWLTCPYPMVPGRLLEFHHV